MRRPVLTLAVHAGLLAATLLAAAPASAVDPAPPSGPARVRAVAAPSWAQAQIRDVTARGLMGGDEAGFRPDDPLTQSELADLVAGLTGRQVQPVADPDAAVIMAVLDSRLVRALELADAAKLFASRSASAGVKVPSRFGTEVVARLLGLRENHPAAQDDLELLPGDRATRAEAAYSASRILGFRGGETAAVLESAETFVLPELGVWQQRVLTTAFGLVGYPYVWGGTTERPHTPAGGPTRGGFDCSGFVLRVFKNQDAPGGERLAATLRGRTTYAMSAEVPPSKRIPLARLIPGDVVFFGAKGPRSKPGEVGHMGIYAGGGWLVHSSSNGVALARLDGWYRARFAWARRPIEEAGLEPLSE